MIDENGEQAGIKPIHEALAYAHEHDLDLVEVAPNTKPPVCRVLDYSKYKYEHEQKAKAARKHQPQVNVREIKLRPKIATHDYNTKKGHVERFLKQHDKVKVTIMFRGREPSHPERGRMLLDRLFEDVSEPPSSSRPPRRAATCTCSSPRLATRARKSRRRQLAGAQSGWRQTGRRSSSRRVCFQ